MLNELINDNNYHLHLDTLQALNKVKCPYYVNLCNSTSIIYWLF